ncbi:Lrp/AsnC family transcriptional regulator [Lentzea sp. NPDC051838]|uniref:Lrp/AsnC family transcriptional regulator n=1 Tax=Lentzea sp. NPDC051838 TaxID=3154849 RepID=UPI0034424CB2
MDALDRKILAHVQADGRLTITELAERVQLSVSRVQRRLRELERAGVIRGYRAVVDAAAIGFGFEALVFAKLRIESMDDFDRALVDVPNVVEAQRLFGSPDYLLRVVTADLVSYQRLYEETLAKLPGVRGLTSTIVMKQVIEPRPLPANP